MTQKALDLNRRQVFKRACLYTAIFLLNFMAISLLAIFVFGYLKYQDFVKYSGQNFNQIKQVIKTGLNQEITHTNNYKNILLLGTDYLETRGESSVLTDTMMIISLNLDSGEINTLSLPRDLYSQEYQTKINALYYYGQEDLVEAVLTDLTAVEIHHLLILGMDQVAEIIDILDGVEVDVPTSFIDYEFPRSDVDVTVETDPDKLYKTVEFQAGKQIMNSQQALEYMRSRKAEGEQGSDDARSERQQLVIQSLVSKLKQRRTLLNTKILGQLYKYYLNNFNKYLNITELIAVTKKLYLEKNLSFKINNNNLSIKTSDSEGVIYHPNPKLYKKQWVYVITDLAEFKNEIKQKLFK